MSSIPCGIALALFQSPKYSEGRGDTFAIDKKIKSPRLGQEPAANVENYFDLTTVRCWRAKKKQTPGGLLIAEY